MKISNKLEEGDVIPLLDVFQHTNKVVTTAEATETIEMTETAADKYSMSRFQGEEIGGSNGDKGFSILHPSICL